MADSRCRPTAGASRSPTRHEGRSGLWVHSFETGQSRHLERAGQFTTSMFWSPDARFIGFVARGAIHRIAVDGTPPQRITPVEDYGGARWTPDGTILYGRSSRGAAEGPGVRRDTRRRDRARCGPRRNGPHQSRHAPRRAPLSLLPRLAQPGAERRVRRLARCRAGRTTDPTGVAAPDATAAVPVAGRHRASAVRS